MYMSVTDVLKSLLCEKQIASALARTFQTAMQMPFTRVWGIISYLPFQRHCQPQNTRECMKAVRTKIAQPLISSTLFYFPKSFANKIT